MTASLENFKRLSIGKNENAEAQPPEPLSQGVGDTFTAIVTHLLSPSEIICQKLENASKIFLSPSLPTLETETAKPTLRNSRNNLGLI